MIVPHVEVNRLCPYLMIFSVRSRSLLMRLHQEDAEVRRGKSLEEG